MGVKVSITELYNNRDVIKAYDQPLNILVGYLQATAGYDDEGTSNLEKAWANEFGVAGKIPERSFRLFRNVDSQTSPPASGCHQECVPRHE